MNMKIFAKLSTVLCFLLALIIGCTEKETQVEVSSVSLNTATIEMVEGETFSLMATVLPKDAEYDGVTWASSNASVASVNSGTVTALKEGTATITASAGEKSATCSVKVSARIIAVTSITLDKTGLSMQVGDTETLTVSIKPNDATDKTVTWSSSDELVVKVADGKVTALKAGQAKITTTVGNIATSCDVVVYQSDNVIIYTTTDKKVLKPYNEDAFGSAIVSNTYVGDVGIITFEKPITFIGNMAFYKQSKLQSIVIPDTVLTVGEKSFCTCTGLLSVKLPQSLTSIDDYAFCECSSMKALTFPDNVLKIGEFAFYSCENAFEDNTLMLPKKLQTILDHAFYGCRLRDIVWPDDLKFIDNSAFCNNDSEEITVPGSVTDINAFTFQGCKLLRKVELNEGVIKLTKNSFWSCLKLSMISLPSSLKSLDDSTPFSDCNLLKDVYIKVIDPSKIDTYGSDPFEDCDKNLLSIWVPMESVEAYKEKWNTYKDNIKGYDF